jgi:hypothetical protein
MSSIKNLLQLISLCILSLSLPKSTSSFHSTGHMVVARIAEIELGGTRMYSQMMDVLGLLSPFTKERDHAFVECAPWADDIKYTGVNTMNVWHFHDNYVNLERPLTKTEIKKMGLESEPQNIVWASNQAKNILRNTKKSLIDDQLNKSIYLRMLIHFYGDLHQPLHNVSLANEEFPKGDNGGNSFKIKMPGFTDLHSLWDTCVGKYPDIRSPLTKEKFDQIDAIAKDVMKQHPRSDKGIQKRLEVTSVNEISNEGIKLAIEYVYKGIENGCTPSDDYLERGRKMIDEQLAVGGYRLTDLLSTLFKDEKVLEKHVKESKGKLLVNQPTADLE